MCGLVGRSTPRQTSEPESSRSHLLLADTPSTQDPSSLTRQMTGGPNVFILFSPLGAALKHKAREKKLEGQQAKLRRPGPWASFLILWTIASGDKKVSPSPRPKAFNGKMRAQVSFRCQKHLPNTGHFARGVGVRVHVSAGSLGGDCRLHTVTLIANPHVCRAAWEPWAGPLLSLLKSPWLRRDFGQDI